MINIIHIFEDSRYGGPQNQCINLLSNINKKKIYNHEILLSENQSSYFKSKCEKLRIKYHKIKIQFLSKNFLLFFNYILFLFSDIKRIYDFLKKNQKFTIVALSNGSTSFKSFIAAKLAKKKIIWHIHDSKSPLFVKLLIYIFSPYVNFFIFSSNSSRKHYEDFVRTKKYKILQTAIDFKNLSFRKNRSKKFTIGLIANFNENKDIIFFIKMIAELNKVNKNFFYMISGRIWKNQLKYYNKCKELINKKKIKNIIIYKDNKNLSNFFNKTNIQVLTSNTESSPSVLWEGMYMKKIVLTTDVGDVKKFIKNGVNGFVLRKDIDVFRDKILSIYNNKLDKRYMMEKSQQTAIKYFNIKFFEKEYTNIINKII